MLSEFQLPFLLPHPFLCLLSLFCLQRDAGPVFERRTRSQKIGFGLGADANLLHAVDQIIWFHGLWLPRRQWGAVNRYIDVNFFINIIIIFGRVVLLLLAGRGLGGLGVFLFCFFKFFWSAMHQNWWYYFNVLQKSKMSWLLRDWDAFTYALISHLIYHSFRYSLKTYSWKHSVEKVGFFPHLIF